MKIHGKAEDTESQISTALRGLTHRSYIEKLTGETALEAPRKAAHGCKFAQLENGTLDVQMMPAMVGLNSVKTAPPLRRSIGSRARESCRSARASGWRPPVDLGCSEHGKGVVRPVRMRTPSLTAGSGESDRPSCSQVFARIQQQQSSAAPGSID